MVSHSLVQAMMAIITAAYDAASAIEFVTQTRAILASGEWARAILYPLKPRKCSSPGSECMQKGHPGLPAKRQANSIISLPGFH
jgi:hypothetical protein